MQWATRIKGFWVQFSSTNHGRNRLLHFSMDSADWQAQNGLREQQEKKVWSLWPFPVLLPYGEVQPKASSSCFHPIRPSEESPTFPARLPPEFEPERVEFKASRQLDHGGCRCQHLLLQLRHEEETLPALPTINPFEPALQGTMPAFHLSYRSAQL